MATNSKITKPTPALIAELQAMSWPSTNAGRMYLKRRGTTADKLGLIFGMAPEGREGISLYDNPAATSAPAAKPGKKGKQARAEGAAQAAVPPAADPFESFAGAIDAQLVAKREEPVTDRVLREFFEAGMTAQAAVDRIIADRTAALEQANAEAEAAVKPAPKAKRGRVGPSPTPAPALGGQVVLRLGDPMDRSAADLWAPKLAKQLRVAIHVCDPVTGEVITTVEPTQPRRAREPGAPRPPSERKGKGDTLTTVIPLLRRDGGLSGAEAQAALGWETPPGPWFFRRWAEQAGLTGELVDLGKVDGVRRFRLKPAPKAS